MKNIVGVVGLCGITLVCEYACVVAYAFKVCSGSDPHLDPFGSYALLMAAITTCIMAVILLPCALLAALSVSRTRRCPYSIALRKMFPVPPILSVPIVILILLFGHAGTCTAF